MIYKFKVWAWLPMTTEVHLAAIDDEDAVKVFKKLDCLTPWPAFFQAYNQQETCSLEITWEP